MSDFVLPALVMGVVATALTDLWAQALRLAFGLNPPNWGMVGRWVAHLGRGRVFHDNIAAAAPAPAEPAIGWAFHYVVGIAFAAILLVLVGPAWRAAPTFMPALILGLVTVGCGWFLLQPGMGAGWAASKRPDAWRVRALNIVSHVVFAIGLYAAARAIAP